MSRGPIDCLPDRAGDQLTAPGQRSPDDQPLGVQHGAHVGCSDADLACDVYECALAAQIALGGECNEAGKRQAIAVAAPNQLRHRSSARDRLETASTAAVA